MNDSPRMKHQEMVNNILQTKQVNRFHLFGAHNVVQRVTKKGPDGNDIEVTEVDDYLPNCVDNNDISRKMYRRNGGITEGWNDTDLFYADGDGDLVQITTAMVNDYWNPKYEGFEQVSGPDWTKNCEDYAKADGEGEESGNYSSTEELAELLPDNGSYVLKLGFHWMRVEKTGDDAITIKQKDAESAVYSKSFTVSDACEYILEKRGFGGTVYKV